MSKVILVSCLLGLIIDFSYCWVINEINTEMLAKSLIDNDVSDDEVDGNGMSHLSKINLIFPGTKWCGAGNVADNYDDLGIEKEADMCCREHDNCPDLIPGGGTKYNLTNEAFYTRSANTRVAKYIGVIYFDGLQTKCFRKDYPITNCSKKGGWFNKKCVKYSYDTNGQKIYQWFDVQEF